MPTTQQFTESPVRDNAAWSPRLDHDRVVAPFSWSAIEPLRQRALLAIERQQTRSGAFTANMYVDGQELYSIETPFVSAIVVLLLLKSCEHDKIALRIVQKALDYLKAQVERSARVCFFGRGAMYPADVDDTTLVYEAIERASPILGRCNAIRMIDRSEVTRQISKTGLVSVWFDCADQGADEDWVVASNVARYLRFVGDNREVLVTRRLHRLVRSRTCRSPYYPDSLIVIGLGLALDVDDQFFADLSERKRVVLEGQFHASIGRANSLADCTGDLPFLLSAIRRYLPSSQMVASLSLCTIDGTVAERGPVICRHVRRNIEYRSPALRAALIAALYMRQKSNTASSLQLDRSMEALHG